MRRAAWVIFGGVVTVLVASTVAERRQTRSWEHLDDYMALPPVWRAQGSDR